MHLHIWIFPGKIFKLTRVVTHIQILSRTDTRQRKANVGNLQLPTLVLSIVEFIKPGKAKKRALVVVKITACKPTSNFGFATLFPVVL